MTDDLRNRPVVVVPVHRAGPLPSEIVSLRQCGKVLSKRDIVILAPKHLDLGVYRELLPVPPSYALSRIGWRATKPTIE